MNGFFSGLISSRNFKWNEFFFYLSPLHYIFIHQKPLYKVNENVANVPTTNLQHTMTTKCSL